MRAARALSFSIWGKTGAGVMVYIPIHHGFGKRHIALLLLGRSVAPFAADRKKDSKPRHYRESLFEYIPT
jgi:hypothetical protein